MRSIASSRFRLVVKVPPVLAFPYIGLGDAAALVGIELDDADAHVGAADVGGEDGVVAGQDPEGGELHAADQAGFVGMILDRGQLHRDAGAGQKERGAAHGQLADAAGDQAAAQHDALGILPARQPHETTHHRRQLGGEFLHHGMDEGGSLRIVARHHLVELRLGHLLRRRVAQRILAMLLQAFAPVRQYRPEGSAAGAITDEAVVVAQFLVIGVDGDGRKHPAPVRKGSVRAGICVGFVRIAQDQLPAHHAHFTAHHWGDRTKEADKGWRQNLCRPPRAASQRGGGSFVATGGVQSTRATAIIVMEVRS